MKKFFPTYGLHLLLTCLGFTLALPFVWMVLTSLKPLEDVDSDSWFPRGFSKAAWRQTLQWKNYRDVFDTKLTTDVTGELSAIATTAKGATSVTVIPSNGNEPVTHTLDRKTAFINPATQAEIPFANVSEGDTLRVKRPGGDGVPFARFYWNSIFVASWITFLQVLTSALAAFAFARLKWKGRDKIFLLYLATMMLPGLVMMIPNYQIMIKLGLVDTYAGLIIPASFSAFGTFLLRQFMLTIPTSLDEAAEIDGASKWQIFWNVIMPLSRPGLITLTIFTFMGSYNSFFWPLVMLKSTAKYTLPVGMIFFDSTRGQVTHLMMAAITMSVLPMVIVYVLLQKQMVKGIQLGAVKG